MFVDSIQTVMSPSKEIQFVIEPSAMFENEYSLGAYIANGEFETSFDNSSKLLKYSENVYWMVTACCLVIIFKLIVTQN